jgi:hypothetical protein
MEVGKNILEVTEEKLLWWFGYVKRMPEYKTAKKKFRMENRGNMKNEKTQREMDGWTE